MANARNVAVLIFNDVELLDFCGPYEVFSITGRRDGSNPFNVFSVAERLGPVTTSNNVSINPRYDFTNSPAADIIIIPGGMGSRREMNNQAVTDWIKTQATKSELVLSVCTGALILAKAGLLEGLEATTHHNAIKLLREMAPNTIVYEDRRLVDNGKIILSAGISAGIDMSFYVVSRLLGREAAVEAAYHMEYDWK